MSINSARFGSRIHAGQLDIGSLAGPGFASGAYPDWEQLKSID